MTDIARDPVLVFRFALREGDLPLAGGLADVLRGEAIRQRLESEISRSWGLNGGPSLGALRAVALLTRMLGLDGSRS